MINKYAAKEGRMRDMQKAQTRAKVLEAARAMIVERGFDAATIRDIAQRAGVATGSVFTTFTDKTELLLEVVFSRYKALLEEIQLATQHSGPDPRARLMAAALTAYTVELREERLLAETMAASWLWSPAIEAEHKRRLEPLLNVIHSAVLASEACRSADHDSIELVCEMIYGCYLRNFRKALFDGCRPGELTARFGKQIDRILAGQALIDRQEPEVIEVSLERSVRKV